MELLIAFATNLLAQFVKGYVAKKWGVAGVYAVVFFIALVGVVIWQYVYTIPTWQAIITDALQTLAYAVALYEVILKRVGFEDTRTKVAKLDA